MTPTIEQDTPPASLPVATEDIDHARQLLFEELADDLRNLRVLSTLPYHKSSFFYDNVTSRFAGNGFLARLGEKAGIGDPFLMLKLLWEARRHDLVLLSGGERADLVYLALAGMAPWIKTPHVIVDAHWQPENGLLKKLQTWLLRLGQSVLIQVQPHSTEEIEIYAAHFGIPKEISRPIPWSTSLMGYSIEPTQGMSIVTGGQSFRDYKTFFEAVRSLPYLVEIGARESLESQGLVKADRQQIKVHTTLDNQAFYEKCAACRVFVLPLVPGLLRSAGDQTILNAMYFGKVVIATDSIASRIYIRDGVNGFLVPPSDPTALSTAIQRVYDMSEGEYAEIARKAEYDAKVTFSEPFRVYSMARAALDGLNTHLQHQQQEVLA